jgi:hypothetical protein
MGKMVLQIAVQVGSIWLSVNVAAIAYLGLSYWFDKVLGEVPVRMPIHLVKGNGKLRAMSR